MIRSLSLLVLLLSISLAGCSGDDEGTENVEKETPPFAQAATLTIPGTSTTDVWGFERSGKEFAVIGDMSSQNRNFSIVDVTDPVNPILVSTTSSPAFDMKVWQNFLYVVDGFHNGPGEMRGTIYNIEDPSAPVPVGNFPSAHNIFIDDKGYLYLSGKHEMIDNELKEFGISIYDLNADPTQPQPVWSSQLPESHDIAVIGDRMFDFHGEMGTFIYDVTDRSSPVFLSNISTGQGFDHSGWITEDGNYLFITNEFAASTQYNFENLGGPDIAIWNISDVSNPVQVGQIHDESSRVHNLYIKGNLAYISYYSAGFKVFNVSDPEAPELIYVYDTNGIVGPGTDDGFNGAFGVYPFTGSGNVFVSDISTDLHIFTSNP
ncbi:LVIVD repeat-containing protein [Salinimicrobium xinjiangense]|uniref:LVIVD repeat-containing protein n=1 Tax=Salinimicrobium xinjiangense TaxID=438596 RepID=UPI000424BD6F|nr:choice-of-anchor B family protein [Salinimicrobium xinjiangense]